MTDKEKVTYVVLKNENDLSKRGLFFKRVKLFLKASASVITVLATIVALVSTYANYQFSKQTLELNKHNTTVSDRERIQAQASLVAAWCGEFNNGKVPVTLVNNSKLPIYNVILVDVNSKYGYDYDNVIAAYRETKNSYYEYVKFFDVIPPGTYKFTLNGKGHFLSGGTDAVDVLFIDSNNQGWYRNIHGNLTNKNDYLADYYSVLNE